MRHVLRANAWSRRRTRTLLEHDQWADAELRSLRDRLLHRTLHAAQRKLARYRDITPPATPQEALAILQSYPVVRKADLLREPRRYYPVSGSLPWRVVGKTSGTTGTPLHIYRSMDSVRWEVAFKERHWAWSGFEAGMPRASLRGDAVIPLDQTRPPFWLFNRFDNQLFLSSRHLKAPFIGQIAETLRKFRPRMLEAYPSTAFALARYLDSQNERLEIPFIYTGSEIVYRYQRELIEQRIGKVLDFYGMAERVAFASECEAGSLHVNSDYSLVEIVDESNRATDGLGFVVGTTFHNLVMPLVRYRTSDQTRWKPGSCACGRPYPMIEPIEGKFEDVVHGAEGEPISPSLITFAFKGVHHIDSSQVAQVRPGVWEIRLVAGPGYTDEDGRQVIRNIHTMVDAKIEAYTKLVPDIPRTAAGKYRWVVNESGSRLAAGGTRG
jgi:phenylacetate-CoA ligase